MKATPTTKDTKSDLRKSISTPRLLSEPPKSQIDTKPQTPKTHIQDPITTLILDTRKLQAARRERGKSADEYSFRVCLIDTLLQTQKVEYKNLKPQNYPFIKACIESKSTKDAWNAALKESKFGSLTEGNLETIAKLHKIFQSWYNKNKPQIEKIEAIKKGVSEILDINLTTSYASKYEKLKQEVNALTWLENEQLKDKVVDCKKNVRETKQELEDSILQLAKEIEDVRKCYDDQKLFSTAKNDLEKLEGHYKKLYGSIFFAGSRNTLSESVVEDKELSKRLSDTSIGEDDLSSSIDSTKEDIFSPTSTPKVTPIQKEEEKDSSIIISPPSIPPSPVTNAPKPPMPPGPPSVPGVPGAPPIPGIPGVPGGPNASFFQKPKPLECQPLPGEPKEKAQHSDSEEKINAYIQAMEEAIRKVKARKERLAATKKEREEKLTLLDTKEKEFQQLKGRLDLFEKSGEKQLSYKENKADKHEKLYVNDQSYERIRKILPRATLLLQRKSEKIKALKNEVKEVEDFILGLKNETVFAQEKSKKIKELRSEIEEIKEFILKSHDQTIAIREKSKKITELKNKMDKIKEFLNPPKEIISIQEKPGTIIKNGVEDKTISFQKKSEKELKEDMEEIEKFAFDLKHQSIPELEAAIKIEEGLFAGYSGKKTYIETQFTKILNDKESYVQLLKMTPEELEKQKIEKERMAKEQEAMKKKLDEEKARKEEEKKYQEEEFYKELSNNDKSLTKEFCKEFFAAFYDGNVIMKDAIYEKTSKNPGQNKVEIETDDKKKMKK